MIGSQNRQEVLMVLMCHFLLACSIVVSFCLLDKSKCFSAVYGVATSVMPVWLFAGRLFRYQGASQVKAIARSLYVGEGLKLGCSALMFWVAVTYLRPDYYVLFLSFMVAQLGLCFSPVLAYLIKK